MQSAKTQTRENIYRMKKTKYRKLTTYQQKCRKRVDVELMHQSIPPAPSKHPPPASRADPKALVLSLPWMVTFRVWGLLSCQFPRGGDEKRGQIPRPPSTLQHFLLITQSNSAILSILMCDFLFELTSSFVIAVGF